MKEIQVQSKPAFEYLMAIKKTLWTTVYKTYPRFGHDTSNIIESVNSSWDGICQLPPLLAMDAIYSKCMKMVYDRLHKPQKSPLLADIPMAKFQTSQRYYVSPSSNGIYQVKIPDSGRKYIVNLTEKECDCGLFMNTSLLVLMELLLQSIRLKTRSACFMMYIQQEHTEKHIATHSLQSQSRI
jgi:hypothetical protein